MNWTSMNFWAVLVAAIAYMAIGAFWYSVLFAKTWTKLTGVTQKDMAEARKKGMAKSMGRTLILDFIACLVMSYIVALFFSNVRLSGVLAGITVGILIWLGFIATTSLEQVLWEKRSIQLYVISNAHHLVGLNPIFSSNWSAKIDISFMGEMTIFWTLLETFFVLNLWPDAAMAERFVIL